MANFDEAFIKIIFNEGGYVNDKDDAGGETYMGICRKYHSDSIIWQYVDELKRSYKSAKTITTQLKQKSFITEAVKQIYKNEYWDEFNLDCFSNNRFAYQIFDSAVNIGVSKTKELLKNIL